MATWRLRMVLFSVFIFHLSFIQPNTKHNKPKIIVVLLYPFTSCEQLITEMPFASAFLVAVETINNSTRNGFTFTLSPHCNDTRCSELVGIKAMTQQWTRDVHAFIGPGNESYCATSARIAASWNLPMVSYVSCRLRYYLKVPMDKAI